MPLFVVATPLGNLEDLTARAKRTLAEADLVCAEDTRRTRGLLSHLGLSKPLVSLHEHNERDRIAQVLRRLEAGEKVALVSDAGTPAVSDPGADVVAAAAAAGHTVVPIPGPSALAAALSVAGFSLDDVLFAGFLPARGKERTAALERLQAHTGVLVLYEAPHRAGETLRDFAALDPARPAVACRELTKVHEEIRRGSLGELAEWASGELRGELTVVLGPRPVAAATPASDAAIEAALRRCLDAGLSTRDAATAVAAVLELPKREVYQRAQQLSR